VALCRNASAICDPKGNTIPEPLSGQLDPQGIIFLFKLYGVD
jgi:hypothetical protein